MSNNVMGKIARLSKESESKLELSSELLELALVDDIGKKLAAMKAAKTQVSTLKKESLEAMKIVREAEKKMDKTLKANAAKASKLISAAEKTQVLIDKANKQAKELGVSPTAIKGLAELEDVAVDVYDIGDDVEQILKRGY
tara:strand:+ start:286 stop:708 length:423 start_codon:yes stop_codon:yes gene_type:complete